MDAITHDRTRARAAWAIAVSELGAEHRAFQANPPHYVIAARQRVALRQLCNADQRDYDEEAEAHGVSVAELIGERAE